MDNDYISHYGVPRRSGRYPWGSGDEPFQRGSENTLNGIARNLNDRDLKSALKSLGIFGKAVSEVKQNPEYRETKELISANLSGSTNVSGDPSDPYDIKNVISDEVLKKLPDNAYWDAERGCWAATGTEAYWDAKKGSWVTVENFADSHIYYNDVSDRWINEKGENVCEASKNLDSLGYRYKPNGIPWWAKWNSKAERWEVDQGSSRQQTKKPLSPSVIKGRSQAQLYIRKKEGQKSLRSALKNMDSFFKRKISELLVDGKKG